MITQIFTFSLRKMCFVPMRIIVLPCEAKSLNSVFFVIDVWCKVRVTWCEGHLEIFCLLNTNVRICRNCEWTFTTNCEPPTDALKYKTGGERKKEKRWICFPTKHLPSLTEETKEKTLCEEAKSCINYSIFRCYKHNFDKHSKLWKNCTVNAIKSFFLVQHHQCMCLLRIYCGLYSAVILWLMIQDDH